MTARGVFSDLLLLAGAGAVGFFFWTIWPPGVWAWTGLLAIGYGWRLGVADAHSSATD